MWWRWCAWAWSQAGASVAGFRGYHHQGGAFSYHSAGAHPRSVVGRGLRPLPRHPDLVHTPTTRHIHDTTHALTLRAYLRRRTPSPKRAYHRHTHSTYALVARMELKREEIKTLDEAALGKGAFGTV